MNALVSMPDLDRMAAAMAKSQLFGMKTPDQVLALMLIAQANGQHPAAAARDYDIIQGRPSKKAEAMLRDFLQAGGSVQWHELTDKVASATFSHPQGGSIKIDWDMPRAKTAGLAGKDMYSKWPRQMLRSRCISEGVRTVFPVATGGMLVPEEVHDMPAAPKNMGQAEAVEPPEELLNEGRGKAMLGVEVLREWWEGLKEEQRVLLLPEFRSMKTAAKQADAERTIEGGGNAAD